MLSGRGKNLKEIKKVERNKLLKLLRILNVQLSFLRTQAKIVSLNEFRKLHDQQAELTDYLGKCIVESYEAEKPSIKVFNKPGRITLRLIKFDRAS